jgi:glyceraldehyde 3-phosphate dehydrogenase
MTEMLRVGINGFGRIGRSIFKSNYQSSKFQVIAINDRNPDIKNIAYQLQYDTQYGRFPVQVEVKGETISVEEQNIPVFHEDQIDNVDWADLGCDVVIDASGVGLNVEKSPNVVAQGVKKVVVTHSPNNVDFTLIFGVNENEYDADKHNIVSSSICDAVAAAPLIKLIEDNIGIESGFLTTMHPYLNYQNLLDGPSESWNWPGDIYHHYAVGRSSVGTLIPKPTSAVDAISKVLPNTAQQLKCMSYRIPTPVVGSANLNLQLSQDSSKEEIHRLIRAQMGQQTLPVFAMSEEPLISVDFLGRDESLIYDQRWTDFASERHLSMAFWYDNEWGYSSRVVDVAAFVGK